MVRKQITFFFMLHTKLMKAMKHVVRRCCGSQNTFLAPPCLNGEGTSAKQAEHKAQVRQRKAWRAEGKRDGEEHCCRAPSQALISHLWDLPICGWCPRISKCPTSRCPHFSDQWTLLIFITSHSILGYTKQFLFFLFSACPLMLHCTFPGLTLFHLLLHLCFPDF